MAIQHQQFRNFAGNQKQVEHAKFVCLNAIDSVRAYAHSKETVILWSKLQAEVCIDKSLRINTVSQNAVETPILEYFKTAFGGRTEKMITSIGRPGNAHEIASVILFLTSPESRWINGTDIAVDGGASAQLTSDLYSESLICSKLDVLEFIHRHDTPFDTFRHA